MLFGGVFDKDYGHKFFVLFFVMIFFVYLFGI